MLYTVVLTFKSVNETLVCDHSNKSYSEQNVHVVLFLIMLHKVVLTFDFKSVNETLVCDHLNESYSEKDFHNECRLNVIYCMCSKRWFEIFESNPTE